MRTIKLSRGLEAIVDDADFDELNAFTWNATSAGYAYRWTARPNRVREAMHRRLMGLTQGDKEHVDHINGNKIDNRRANLRFCTQLENNRNIWKPNENASGYKGASWDKKKQKWRARINDSNAKEKWLGYFDTPEIAYGAYCDAAKKYHGEFANFGTADVPDLDALIVAAKKRQEESKRVFMVDTPDGQMTLAELAAKTGLSPQAIKHRLVQAKWPLEKALSKPSLRPTKAKEERRIAKMLGIPVQYADEAQRAEVL